MTEEDINHFFHDIHSTQNFSQIMKKYFLLPVDCELLHSSLDLTH